MYKHVSAKGKYVSLEIMCLEHKDGLNYYPRKKPERGFQAVRNRVRYCVPKATQQSAIGLQRGAPL